MERRKFLSWVGAGFVASSLPVAIAACTPERAETDEETSSSSPEETREDGFVSIGTVEQLEQDGSLIDKENNIIVVQDGDAAKALSSICTHQQCDVKWQQSSQSLYCSCHGSEFDPAGQVLNGPATEPLSSYAVKKEDNQILVKSS